MVGTLSPSLVELRRDKSLCPPTVCELICFARKRNFMQRPATNWRDGEITQNLSSPSCKNIPLNVQAKSVA
jgi:hypothetical protein